jgi:hypothetical protein
MYARPAALEIDYGHPVGDCAEVTDGQGAPTEVFARQYSNADVSIDCASFAAKIEMTAGPHKGAVNPGAGSATPPPAPVPAPRALGSFSAVARL